MLFLGGNKGASRELVLRCCDDDQEYGKGGEGMGEE